MHSAKVKSNMEKANKYMNTIKKTMGEIKPVDESKKTDKETCKKSSKIAVKVTKKGKRKTSKKKSKAVRKSSSGSVSGQSASSKVDILDIA